MKKHVRIPKICKKIHKNDVFTPKNQTSACLLTQKEHWFPKLECKEILANYTAYDGILLLFLQFEVETYPRQNIQFSLLFADR